MAVYLVQHGLAFTKEADPGRGLTPEGAARVRLIAEVAAQYRVQVGRIEHSGKQRAQQTAEILAEVLRPRGGTVARDGLNPMDMVEPLGAECLPAAQVMLVGHLPFMERLASYLTTGVTHYTPFRFQPGGIVCLDRDGQNTLWHVKWALMPDIS